MAKRIRGRDLRQARISAGLTLAQVAVALGTNRAALGDVENETFSEFPSPEFAQRYIVACENGLAA